MHPLIRFAAALILLSIAALSVLAGPESSPSTHPVFHRFGRTENPGRFLPDSGLSRGPERISGTSLAGPTATTIRICSCQVLNLQSSNYDHRYVVLLAERTNDESSTSFKVARNRIEKEKKQLKKLFYNKVKLITEMKAGGSCKSLYFRLRNSDAQLQLYEILSAD